jgi:Xaa-Pro aminopeptidase
MGRAHSRDPATEHEHPIGHPESLYFVPALLNDAGPRERHRDAVDWERAEAMLGFGGIRIEINVLITDDDGNEVLTADVP